MEKHTTKHKCFIQGLSRIFVSVACISENNIYDIYKAHLLERLTTHGMTTII